MEVINFLSNTNISNIPSKFEKKELSSLTELVNNVWVLRKVGQLLYQNKQSRPENLNKGYYATKLENLL